VKITWDNGYVEFFENSFHAVQGKGESWEHKEMFAQYADITRVEFYDNGKYGFSVQWYINGNQWVTCPVAKDIFDALTKRLRQDMA